MHFLLNFRYLDKITMVICQYPELALFFDMYDLLQHNFPFTKSHQTNYDDKLEQCSIGIQTDTHPIPYRKDKHYKWNLWDMRRETVQLANLQICRTKSTQTSTQNPIGFVMRS